MGRELQNTVTDFNSIFQYSFTVCQFNNNDNNNNNDDDDDDDDNNNVFVFGDFNVHHKDWLTCCGGTDRPGELCHNFSVSDDLTQMINHSWNPPTPLLKGGVGPSKN